MKLVRFFTSLVISLFFLTHIRFVYAVENSSVHERLYQAVLNDSPGEIRAAVQSGANVNYSKANKSLLFWAIVLNKAEAAKVLVEIGSVIDESCIEQALKMHIPSICRTVPSGCTTTESTNCTTSCNSSIPNDISFAVLLAKKAGMDIDKTYNGATLLGYALGCGEYESLIQLIRMGASPEKIYCGAYACCVDFEIIIRVYKELLNQNYLVNKLLICDPWSAWLSYSDNSDKIIEFLINNGADPNYIEAYDKEIMTPLGKALLYGNVSVVRALLSRGADVNQKITSSNTGYKPTMPLYYVMHCNSLVGCSHRKPQVIELLLSHGASFD